MLSLPLKPAQLIRAKEILVQHQCTTQISVAPSLVDANCELNSATLDQGLFKRKNVAPAFLGAVNG